ncbi:hypothetical protein BDB01DRAFT_848352 [Pilobolus umbonatus]|nr:hypothetical protein BDB01DRAFT_848352 [Pilobolus umbonatus]
MSTEDRRKENPEDSTKKGYEDRLKDGAEDGLKNVPEDKIRNSPEVSNTRRQTEEETLKKSQASTDNDEIYDDRILIDDGIPANVPLESLAGPALITPSNDIDSPNKHGEFDWSGKEDDDEELDRKENEANKKRGILARNSVIICLSENQSYIAWFCIVLFGLMLISTDVVLFYVFHDEVSMLTYNLQLWITYVTFMWCIVFLSQIAVEIIPWAIKKGAHYLRPQTTEVLRMKLSYYMALRKFTKLLLIAAWSWGSWAFIQDQIKLPVINRTSEYDVQYASKPGYVPIFFNIWECFFFGAALLFIEKFILQLIVTSFHKKAYGDRIKENDNALKILDQLKKFKRKNPQEFLLKRIKRKSKTPMNGSATNTATPSRSASVDEMEHDHHYKSIMVTPHDHPDTKGNVKFPSHNIEMVSQIPPVDDKQRFDERFRSDSIDKEVPYTDHDEKRESINPYATPPQFMHSEDEINTYPPKKNRFIKKLTEKMKKKTDSSYATANVTEAFSMDHTYQNHPKEEMHHRPTLSRDNTWFTRSSTDGKHFVGGTNDNSTGIMPAKFLKNSYTKFLSPANLAKNAQNSQNSTQQAKILAKKIYHNLIGPDSYRDHIIESDLYPFFNSIRESKFAFSLFDADGNGDISKRELRAGCIRIYRERKNLARSMRDLSQATGKLDNFLMIIFCIIWIIIVCAAFGVNVGTDLMPLWSAFVAASFVFGTSAKDAFEAIIFVFVIHPFDSGDRVFINGENWVVHNVGLLVTTFLKWDGSVVYAKNSVLTTQYIINVRRSGKTSETVELQIGFGTPSWKIRTLKDHMCTWSNKYPKLYTPNSTSCNILAYKNQNSISMSFCFEHTENWQDAGGRWLRHNNFMMELKEELERLHITYTLPVQPLEQNPPNDASPESYNMGDKAGYGLDGLVRRRGYEDDDFKDRTGDLGSGGLDNNGDRGNDNAGPAAGAAATMMFVGAM